MIDNQGYWSVLVRHRFLQKGAWGTQPTALPMQSAGLRTTAQNPRRIKTFSSPLVITGSRRRVPGPEQPPRSIQELLGPDVCVAVWVLFLQEPDVADQMRPTVLGFDPIGPGEGTVGGEIIEVQITGELGPHQRFQDFSRPCGGDVKD